MSTCPYILSFKEIRKEDTDIVGGKSANLGEMTNADFPVPEGFATTIYAYDEFLKQNNITKQIYNILKICDVHDPNQLNEASRKIRKLITHAKVPENIQKELINAYRKLVGRENKVYVAVRSSATAEDMPTTSFAGQQITFLNVRGEANIIENLKACWASLFTERSIFYRVINKVPHEKVKISVIIQKMIQSEVSGVAFSIDPVTNQKDRIVIEAVWGLGEMIVQGSVVPDKYVVQKETFFILSKEISSQKAMLVKKGERNRQVKVRRKDMNKQKITDEEIIILAKLADKMQRHYFYPQDIEWAKYKGKIYMIQTRPVTTIKKEKEIKIEQDKENKFKITQAPILSGTAASPGIGTGTVKIVMNPKNNSKVKNGDVLVAPMTSPDFVPAMKKAAAIITDEGGQTSHAAIVSRELGVPCVVGTKEATKKLEDDMIVSVDGAKGEVYLGGKIAKEVLNEEKEEYYSGKTATKLYVNLAEPDRAKEVAKMNVDGVGLLRAEFMIADIGIHPKEAIKLKKQDKFINELSDGISNFCKEFYPRPVIYRATDFKTNEYRALQGGKYWEPQESNPMLGFRGAYRYIVNPEVFNLELQALKRVRNRYSNLWLMIPFVRSPQELEKVKKLVRTEGFFESNTFKFFMMVELPVNVILLEDFIKVGIDGVSIGSNDLTMLLLGVDRDNAEVADVFDERSPAVSWALRRIAKTCQKNKIMCSICGQAPSEYQEIVEELVKYGVTSISVNPDTIDKTRTIIHRAERKLLSK